MSISIMTKKARVLRTTHYPLHGTRSNVWNLYTCPDKISIPGIDTWLSMPTLKWTRFLLLTYQKHPNSLPLQGKKWKSFQTPGKLYGKQDAVFTFLYHTDLYKHIDVNKGTVVYCNCINYNANCSSWFEQVCNATLICFQTTQDTLGNLSGDLKFAQSSKRQITKETLLHFLSECPKWGVKLLLWHIFFQPDTCCDVLTYQCIVFLPDMVPYFDKTILCQNPKFYDTTCLYNDLDSGYIPCMGSYRLVCFMTWMQKN